MKIVQSYWSNGTHRQILKLQSIFLIELLYRVPTQAATIGSISCFKRTYSRNDLVYSFNRNDVYQIKRRNICVKSEIMFNHLVKIMVQTITERFISRTYGTLAIKVFVFSTNILCLKAHFYPVIDCVD